MWVGAYDLSADKTYRSFAMHIVDLVTEAYTSSVYFVWGGVFARKYIYEKLTKCLNFT